MKKEKIEFEVFNDGICTIHETDEEGEAGKVLLKARYANRIIGTQRFYNAMSNKVQINKLIRIPMQDFITNEHKIAIRNKGKEEVYDIIQVQQITGKNPNVTDITLKKINMKG